jgi:hypothetical protein
MADAKVAWSAMRDEPKALQRPIVVLGGIYDPGIAAARVEKSMREIVADVDDDRIIHIGFLECGSFDRSAAKVIAAVNKRFPSDDPMQTIEVDVIGFSMGGLVARYAASDMYAEASGRRLRIHRLFTVSSPHQGAKLAWVPTFDKRVIDMRAESPFLDQLNAESCGYEVITYARLGDAVVGEANACIPPDEAPRWVSKHRGLSHMSAYRDTRILADIARRLRRETPLSTDPPASLPRGE